ncbi:hypothetical protein N7508_007404 [Penicillium antarcticum]|uniref:uncharacterized protein n=1 Tax=Penicillium antarcticum TaxID=416450 RepID=UPI00238A616D|nr:uncharacterized protein N7508_007404 [Penicillium antarcticum]KAJ5300161.1 hypothetical protein N7508_007404 [Penicillium antarcticum]
MLHALPPELFSMVLEYFYRNEDLKNLCLVSKALHSATIPRLYRSIGLISRNEDNLSDLNLGSLSRYLKFTREVILIAEFRQLLRYRCHDHDSDDSDDSNVEYDSSSDETELEYQEIPRGLSVGEDENGGVPCDEDQENQPNNISQLSEWRNDRSDISSNGHSHADFPEGDSDDLTWQEWTPHGQFMKILASRIRPFLDLIPDGRLERFSWNLGTCVPGAVIEYLSTKQTQIVHLEVITDTTCLGLDYLNMYDLYGFKKLRRLRLITPTFIQDPEYSLGGLFHNNASTLEEIEINEVGHGGLKSRVPGQNKLLHQMLALPPGEMQQLFPSLKNLTLSAVSLENGGDVMPSVFSLNCLHSLALRNCEGSAGLLKALGSDDVLPHSMRLKSFEYLANGMLGESWAMDSIANFLISFEGLQDLFLSFLDVFENSLLNNPSAKSNAGIIEVPIPHVYPTLKRNPESHLFGA